MSIYASLPGIEDARIYRGPNIVPGDSDPAIPAIGLALIPSHITRDGHDSQMPEDGRAWPWLRVDIFDGGSGFATAVIDPTQARDLARQLTEWADATKPTEYEEQS